MSEQVLRGGNVMERSRTRTLTQIAMLGAVAGVSDSVSGAIVLSA